MKITKELIKERFDVLNYQCFNNEIKVPDKITINHSFKQAGSISQDNKTKKLTLAISDGYAFTDSTLEDVIAHEMIHLKLIQDYGFKKAGHNKYFKKIMHLLNDMYGLHVELNAKNIPFTKNAAKRREQSYPKNKILKKIIKLFEKYL